MSLYGDIPLLGQRPTLELIEQGRGVEAAPLHVRFEPTESCNFSCQFCVWHDPERRKAIEEHLDATGKRHFPKERLKSLIDELSAVGTRAVSFTGTGDPMVYPYMNDALTYLHEHGIATGVTSNFAMPLKDNVIEKLAHCHWIRWSMNGGTTEGYQAVHRPRERQPHKAFLRAQENISRIATAINKADRNTHFNASFVIHNANQSDIYKAARLAKTLGLSSIAFRPDTPFERDEEPLKYSEKVKELLLLAKSELETDKFKVFGSEERLEDAMLIGDPELICYYINHTTYIAANGDLYPCCYTRYDKRYIIGNILEQSFSKFWLSEKRQNFYKQIYFDNCPSCPYGKTNQTLEQIYNKKIQTLNVYIENIFNNDFI